MAFVTLNEILADCQSEGADGRHPWAVPAFDVINMETVYAALGGAVAERAPVILMVLPGHTPVSMWPGLVAMIRAEAERSDVPVCLHLDHAKELGVIRKALERLMQGRTAFIIAHRIQSVMGADLILVLDHGRIVQRGTHDTLLAEEGVYRQIYDVQARIETELGREIEESLPEELPVPTVSREKELTHAV